MVQTLSKLPCLNLLVDFSRIWNLSVCLSTRLAYRWWVCCVKTFSHLHRPPVCLSLFWSLSLCETPVSYTHLSYNHSIYLTHWIIVEILHGRVYFVLNVVSKLSCRILRNIHYEKLNVIQNKQVTTTNDSRMCNILKKYIGRHCLLYTSRCV